MAANEAIQSELVPAKQDTRVVQPASSGVMKFCTADRTAISDIGPWGLMGL